MERENKLNKNYELWVDYIKVYAAFSVVLLHSAGPLLYKYNELPHVYWWIGNLYDSFTRVCVPLFFMISGYLLLSKTEKLSVFFAKRFRRVLVPLVAWSIIYTLWQYYYNSTSLSLTFSSIYGAVLSPVYYHLWFLYAIIGLYFVIPILRVFINNSSRNMHIYYVMIWFVAVSLIPLIEKCVGTESHFDLLAISGYSGYLVLGLLLGKCSISSKMFFWAGMIFVGSGCFTAFATYLLTSMDGGEFSGYFYQFQSPNVIIMSSTAYVLVKYLVEKSSVACLKKPRIEYIVQLLSGTSFGIYLVHPIFLELLKHGSLGVTLSCFAGNPIYSILLTAVTVFLVSFLTSLVIGKIPLIRRIIF